MRVNFDDFIRKKVEDYRPEPSEKILQKILSEYAGKKNNNSWFFLSLLLFGLIGMSSIITFGIWKFIIGDLKPESESRMHTAPLRVESSLPLTYETSSREEISHPRISENKSIPANNEPVQKHENIPQQKAQENTQQEKDLYKTENITDAKNPPANTSVKTIEENNPPQPSLQTAKETIEKKDSSSVSMPLKIEASKHNACVNEVITFTATPEYDGNYRWDFGDKYFSFRKTTTHVYKFPGVYNYSLRIKLKDGKVIKAEGISAIKINPAPSAKIEIREIDNNRIAAINTSGYKVQKWLIDGKETPEKANEIIIYRGTISRITLIVENEYSCTDTTTQTISISSGMDNTTYMFSPDGDNINDTWFPVNHLPRDYQSFTLMVYDKHGNLLYSISNEEKWWDGIIQEKGIKVPPNSQLVWILQYTRKDGSAGKTEGLLLVNY
mgnify:CR=1 FL=1